MIHIFSFLISLRSLLHCLYFKTLGIDKIGNQLRSGMIVKRINFPEGLSARRSCCALIPKWELHLRFSVC